MTELRAGEPVRVAGRTVPVIRLLAPNAGPMTGPGTNTYLIGERELALVDPGPAEQAHIEAILTAIGDRPLRWILVTHTHADHSPAALPLARATGAELIGLPAPEGGRHDRSFQPSGSFAHGDSLAGAEFTIELIHTPGHVSNHLCYLLQEEQLLFTGDHILQGTTSVILPPDGDMTDYLRSLHELRAWQLACLAPGHGQLITDPEVAIEALIAHRLRREDKIVRALGAGVEADLESLTLRVYDDVAPHLLPWARLTLEAHLIKLARESRAVQSPTGWKLLP
ncbi:MAG: MBL fold metallo-hydrolase [Gammaproteobacteria bacterium]|nr:MBL fold metallo-hydrolase [Pseudomonadales bacterium]MCP5345621.1 MBL fold metallo-hydrolase [Pseudomonadales bacterium]